MLFNMLKPCHEFFFFFCLPVKVFNCGKTNFNKIRVAINFHVTSAWKICKLKLVTVLKAAVIFVFFFFFAVTSGWRENAAQNVIITQTRSKPLHYGLSWPISGAFANPNCALAGRDCSIQTGGWEGWKDETAHLPCVLLSCLRYLSPGIKNAQDLSFFFLFSKTQFSAWYC